MNEFKDQLDAAEKDKVTKLLAELREIAVKGQAADPSVTADAIREKINETQQASLGLFQKAFPFSRCLFASSDTSGRSTRRRMQRTMPRQHQSPRKRRKRRRINPSSAFPYLTLSSHSSALLITLHLTAP
jgi:hypothetical protein